MSAQLQESVWCLEPMDVSHLDQIMAIERRSYEFPWTQGIFEDCLKVGYSSWVVTGMQGEILGYALFSMAVGEGHILNLCVAPEHRGLGLARFLIEHLMQLARAGHLTILLLEVRRSNKTAIRLYESFGFRRVGVRKDYYPAAEGREDAYVLAFDIP